MKKLICLMMLLAGCTPATQPVTTEPAAKPMAMRVARRVDMQMPIYWAVGNNTGQEWLEQLASTKTATGVIVGGVVGINKSTGETEKALFKVIRQRDRATSVGLEPWQRADAWLVSGNRLTPADREFWSNLETHCRELKVAGAERLILYFERHAKGTDGRDLSGWDDSIVPNQEGLDAFAEYVRREWYGHLWWYGTGDPSPGNRGVAIDTALQRVSGGCRFTWASLLTSPDWPDGVGRGVLINWAKKDGGAWVTCTPDDMRYNVLVASVFQRPVWVHGEMPLDDPAAAALVEQVREINAIRGLK